MLNRNVFQAFAISGIFFPHASYAREILYRSVQRFGSVRRVVKVTQ